MPSPPPQLLPQMGIWHSIFFRGGTGLTYVCPWLVRKGVLRWRDLVVAGAGHLEHLDIIAYMYKMAYDMGVQDVRLQSMAPDEGARGLAWDRWGAGWGRQHVKGHSLVPTRSPMRPPMGSFFHNTRRMKSKSHCGKYKQLKNCHTSGVCRGGSAVFNCM